MALFGRQAAIALDPLERSRRAQAMLSDEKPAEKDGSGELEGVAAALKRIDDRGRRKATLEMVDALVRLLRESQGPPAIRLRRR